MSEPIFSPNFNKITKLILRTLLAIFVLLASVAMVISFDVKLDAFKKEYRYSKKSWQTKVLPANEMITIVLQQDDFRSNFGLNPDYFMLSGYYNYGEPTPIKGDPNDLTAQVIYTEQSNIPAPTANKEIYQINQITLLYGEHLDYYKEANSTYFLKEATIIGVGDGKDNTQGNPQLIGKRIVTGTDFVKNEALNKQNLKYFYIISHSIIALLLILIVIFGIKFHRKLNIFEKGIAILIAIFYTAILYDVYLFHENLYT